MNWDDLRYFLTVSRVHSLKLAAIELKVDQATVGRRLKILQSSLGVNLLEKRSNGFFLTSSGERILESTNAAEFAILSAERLITGKDERVEGTVKIAMPGAMANQWIIKTLHPLLQKYPKLELQFLTGAEVLNLSRRQADIALRLVRPTQRDLKTRKLGSLSLGLYASRSFKLKGQLAEVPFIGLYESSSSELERNFLSRFEFTPNYRIRSAAWSSVYASVQAGLGMGILPTFIGDKDTSLKVLKSDSASAPLWLVVHPEISKSARVRAVIEFLEKLKF